MLISLGKDHHILCLGFLLILVIQMILAITFLIIKENQFIGYIFIVAILTSVVWIYLC